MAEDLNIGMKCVKYMLFVANFLFVLTSLLVISIGSVIKTAYGDFDLFLSDHFFSPAKLMVAIGILMLCISFFGCVGAMKQSTFLINVYAALLSMVFIMEISAAIAALVLRGNIVYSVEQRMYPAMYDYERSPAAKETWDFTQSALTCCGIESYKDWEIITQNQSDIFQNGHDFPSSCCTSQACDFVYLTGCGTNLAAWVSQSALLLSCGAIAVSFIQLVGIIFARMLAQTVRNLKTKALVERQLRRQQIYSQLILPVGLNDHHPEKVILEEKSKNPFEKESVA